MSSLYAAIDRQHARAQDIGEIMDHAALVATIGNTSGKLFCDAELALRLSQHQHTAVRRQPPAIERGSHFLAANRGE